MARAVTKPVFDSEIDVETPLEGDVDIAAAAALMADPSRAAVLAALTDGRALPPSELAEVAGVSRSTMSEHLAKLRDAGFLAVERGGRNRYYRLAGPEVATAVEALSALAPRAPVRSLRQANRAGALGAARTCYAHLAGRLGVGITDAMVDRGLVEREAESSSSPIRAPPSWSTSASSARHAQARRATTGPSAARTSPASSASPWRPASLISIGSVERTALEPCN